MEIENGEWWRSRGYHQFPRIQFNGVKDGHSFLDKGDNLMVLCISLPSILHS